MERAEPDELLAAVATYRRHDLLHRARQPIARSCRSSPRIDISSLRKCVSAGETLPQATFEAWQRQPGSASSTALGSTEMLHIFICSPERGIRPAPPAGRCPAMRRAWSTTKGREVPPDTVGRLAVRGPTGCRYLADPRQRKYVRDGWNLTGDTYLMDDRRVLLVSGALRRHDHLRRLQHRRPRGRGGALLAHPASPNAAWWARPTPTAADREGVRGTASRPGRRRGARRSSCRTTPRRKLRPTNIPRAIEYVAALPRTPTGKLQRFELRRMAAIATARSSPREGPVREQRTQRA